MHSMLMSELATIIHQAFSVDGITSIVFRAVVWLVISIIIILNSNQPDDRPTNSNLKAHLGFFLFFLFAAGALIYLLFGFTTASSVYMPSI